MPVLAQGQQFTRHVSFNQGTLDINGYELAILQDITVSIEFSTKEIRELGSIIMSTAPKRHGFKTGAKAKVKSVNQQLFGFMMGESAADSTGFDYSILDGQNVLTRASVRCYVDEDPTKVVEFQFTNAILAGNLSTALKSEDASESDVEIQAQNVTVVTNFAGL